MIYAKRRKPIGRGTEILLFNAVSWQLYIPLGVTVVGLAIVGSDLGNLLRHLVSPSEGMLDAFGDPTGKEKPYPLKFYSMVIQAPLFKEVLFRGVILGGLLAHRTPARAIVWSAVLFAIIHINPWQFPARLPVGNRVRMVCRSNRFPVARHHWTCAEQLSDRDGFASWRPSDPRMISVPVCCFPGGCMVVVLFWP